MIMNGCVVSNNEQPILGKQIPAHKQWEDYCQRNNTDIDCVKGIDK